MSDRPRFHLAFPVTDIAATRAFYEGLLGCRVGRSAERWIDLDFYGHQLSAHLCGAGSERAEPTNRVDGDAVPVPHFGAILEWDAWHALADRLRAGGVEFVIEPRVRFRGQPGEQATMFFRDPSGNALELKSFRNDAAVFATE